MNLVKKYSSPNFNKGRNGWKPDIIVDHITGAGGTYMSAIYWFQNPQSNTSSQFILAKDGTVYQMVDLENTAWCNGTSVKGDVRDYRKATSSIVKSRATNANYYTISIEHENDGGGELTDAQLKASIELHKYIIDEVKRIYGITIPADRQHIIGHCEINPINRPNCPGVNFPFTTIINALNGQVAPTPIPNVVPITPTPISPIQISNINKKITISNEVWNVRMNPISNAPIIKKINGGMFNSSKFTTGWYYIDELKAWIVSMAVVSAVDNYKTYTVVDRDSFWGIAQKVLKNGGRYKEIISLNGLTENSVIKTGDILKIPNK